MTRDPARDRLMNHILAELELASTAKAATLEARTSQGKPSGNEPKSGGAPHRYYRWLYFTNAKTDEDRRKALEAALQELRHIRFSRRPKVDMETAEGRLQIGRDPRPASVVAHVYGYSIRHVRRLRALARSRDRGVR